MTSDRSPSPDVPTEVVALADARALARADRDWAEADRLLAELLARGWKPIDRGLSYRLEPAHPADVEDAHGRRYGRSEHVASRLHEPSTRATTIVIPILEVTAAASLASLDERVATDAQRIVVLDGPAGDDPGAVAAFDPATTEVVRTSAPLGWAAATNIGIRRSQGDMLVVLDPATDTGAPPIAALAAALADPAVAVAGMPGLVSSDLRRFEEAASGYPDAIGSACLAFRRADAVARGPLDESLRTARGAAIWWSLVLRDEGLDQPPRRAVRVAATTPSSAVEDEARDGPNDPRDRAARRDGYRILDRFRDRLDLLGRPAG